MIPFHITLKTLRQEQGLSQEQLAEALGTSRQTVSKWESGAALPDAINLISLSDFFGVTTDALLRGISESEPTAPVYAPSPDEPSDEAEATFPTLPEPPTPPKTETSRPQNNKFEYEYISSKRLFGLPLVHIHVGLGLYRAKGVVAIGMLSKGLISIGLLSMGLLSFGVLALGLLVFGGFALGLAAFGGVSLGALAVAGISVGLFSIGGISLGVISVGGIAIASRIAVGGVAIAPTSLDVVKGIAYILTETGTITLTAAEVEAYLQTELPYLPNWLVRLIVELIG